MIADYLKQIAMRHKTGIAREHSYRGDLQHLLQALNPNILVTNEPARIACGAPDYILTQNGIPVGYIEAKDIGVSLDKTAHSEQLHRYRASLDNLILTDYVEFRYYKQGAFVMAVTLAEIRQGTVTPLPNNFDAFTQLMQEFCAHVGQTITSAAKLAGMMAGKARLLQMVIEQALVSADDSEPNSSLHDQMAAFKKILIHDIQPAEFADIYAQTIAYGMFAARLNDPSLDTFSRREAAELIPKTNPFLRKLFSYIAGIDIDDRIVWIVDALADVFRATDVAKLLENFGKATQMHDPIIHFYETFLAEYNPKLRKSRGVWYTPEPVVNFIVRAVDDILKIEFGLPQGLADTSKITLEVDTQVPDQRSKTGYKRATQELHKVQILDPAAGTGTFLAEVIKQIHKKFTGQQGIWSTYVEDHLIPRLHGFEILMASYAMAHLKLDLLLRETGYIPKTQQRLRVFLTNSLEEAHPDTGTLWASWLSREATEANYIKRETPVMVVLGNPPYSGESSNKGEWITSLMEDYKKEPGGKQKLQERNPKFINDDYVKFLRYGQYFVEKNGEGIVAFINPHGFLDNPTFRGMRWNLLRTFDKIYTIDLHGNSNRKETCPDGSPDVNVFDIQQGVSVNLLVKTGRKRPTELGSVFHYDLYGQRSEKYNFLGKSRINSVEWAEVAPQNPAFLFTPQDYSLLDRYSEGFSLNELFIKNSIGIQTHADAIVLGFTLDELQEQVTANGHVFDRSFLSSVTYRPFDKREFYNNSKIVHRPRHTVAKHLDFDNFTFCFMKQFAYEVPYSYALITRNRIIDRVFISNKGAAYFAPLYLYPDREFDGMFAENVRKPNLDDKIIQQIATSINLPFVPEKGDSQTTFSPIDVIDYIYAVLHAPAYRTAFKEFLKIDFPRIPYPKNADTFWQLVEFGGELRQLHLLESPQVEQYITTYPQDGNNIVTRKMMQKDYELQAGQQTGRVWINDTQYFDNVPRSAWEFYIGGYQPAQKWLKDRHGRELSFEDIRHYQKIIVALTATDRIMQAVDAIEFMS